MNVRSQTAKTTLALFGKNLVSFNHGWSFFMIIVSRMTDMITVLNKDDMPETVILRKFTCISQELGLK